MDEYDYYAYYHDILEKLKEEGLEYFYDDIEYDTERTSEASVGLSASSGILHLVRPSNDQEDDNFEETEESRTFVKSDNNEFDTDRIINDIERI